MANATPLLYNESKSIFGRLTLLVELVVQLTVVFLEGSDPLRQGKILGGQGAVLGGQSANATGRSGELATEAPEAAPEAVPVVSSEILPAVLDLLEQGMDTLLLAITAIAASLSMAGNGVVATLRRQGPGDGCSGSSVRFIISSSTSRRGCNRTSTVGGAGGSGTVSTAMRGGHG